MSIFDELTSVLNPAGILRGQAVMALNLATTRLLGETVTIVDAGTFLPVFYGAEPMRVSVRPSSRVMKHPVETGAVIADHHIIEPREFEVSLVIPATFYISVYQQIVTAYDSASLLILKTNADVYENLIVSAMPHEESPETNGVLVMGLRLTEVLYAPQAAKYTQNGQNLTTVPSNYAPSNPVNSNTISRGQCTLEDPLGTGTTTVRSFKPISKGAW
jgi:hypothetical protein